MRRSLHASKACVTAGGRPAIGPTSATAQPLRRRSVRSAERSTFTGQAAAHAGRRLEREPSEAARSLAAHSRRLDPHPLPGGEGDWELVQELERELSEAVSLVGRELPLPASDGRRRPHRDCFVSPPHQAHAQHADQHLCHVCRYLQRHVRRKVTGVRERSSFVPENACNRAC